MDNHEKSQHFQKFQCVLCFQNRISSKLDTFDSIQTLDRHIKVFHGTTLKCTVCKNFKANTQENLVDHLSKCHQLVTNSFGNFKCERFKNCNFTTKFESQFVDHCHKFHFFCPSCHFKYLTSIELREHLENDSHQIYHYCSQCSSKFFNSIQLKQHMIEDHETEVDSKRSKRFKKYSCSLCNFSSNYEYVMKYHGPWKHKICPVCSVQVKGDANDMIHHVWKIHSTKIMCDTCGKLFFSEDHFKVHQDNHFRSRSTCVPKKQNKEFKCNFCNFSSSCNNRTSRIKRHVIMYPYIVDSSLDPLKTN